MNNIDKDLFDHDISIEEFDQMTDGVEDHVFSERYLKRKEIIMNNASHKAKTTKLGMKIAAAAAAVIVATPFAANAATGGELFDRLWGNSGKENVESYSFIYTEDGKIDNNGNAATYPIDMPAIEYVEVDPETAQRLIGDKITTEPVVFTIGDYTFTIESVVRDGTGVVVAYTIENESGANILNYSQLDNESKGAWINDDQNYAFWFEECDGKIWVDLERSTSTKVCCNAYMFDHSAIFGSASAAPIGDHITLNVTEYTVSRNEMWESTDGEYEDFIKDSKSFVIPVADKLDSAVLTSASGDTIRISPIAMDFSTTDPYFTCDDDGNPAYPIDKISSVKITFTDGSEYLLFDDSHNNCGYLCGDMDGLIVAFNRLVDTDAIAKITVNDIEFTK